MNEYGYLAEHGTPVRIVRVLAAGRGDKIYYVEGKGGARKYCDKGKNMTYFPSFTGAKAFLIKKLQSKIDSCENQLNHLESDLARIKSLNEKNLK